MAGKGVLGARNRTWIRDDNPDIDWRLEAACREYPGELWFQGELEQLDNLLEAQRICARCPVSDECLASASKGDLEYSMRAGLMPTMQATKRRGRPSKFIMDRCPNGHDVSMPGGLTYNGDCGECASINPLWRNRRRKTERSAKLSP